MTDKAIVDLLRQLIKIDSQNPPGNEAKIIALIRGYLKKIGVKSRIYEFKKNRPNLVCEIKSRNRRRKILLTPHVDTVPALGRWKFGPFSGKIHKGRIYGRGASDCKVNVAAALYLIKYLRENKIVLNNLDLIFAFCADEETGSYLGTIPLMKKLNNIDYGIVLDADEFDIVIAQKGLLHLRVEIFGKEAHGAYPERGVNAIDKAVKILNSLLDKQFACKKHPLLIKPTLNIGKIEGGSKVNVVAGKCSFDIDIRWLPSMTKKQIINRIKSLIKKQKARYKITVLAEQDPIEIDRNSFLIKNLKTILKGRGIRPTLKASFGATVINFLTDKGIEAFAFGFGSRKCAHATDEYVKLDNLREGVGVLKDYLRTLDEALCNISVQD